MAGEDEDFDVEAWNRRFDESPSGPTGPPRVRTRGAQPTEPDAPGGALFGDPLEGTEAVVEDGGFPAFEHNQWTVEGEIERFGALGRGVSGSRGWKRGMAVGLLTLLLLPFLIQLVQIVARLFS